MPYLFNYESKSLEEKIMRATLLANGRYQDVHSYLTITTNSPAATLTYGILLQQVERLLSDARSQDLG
jgi:hypothetical protein